MENYSACVNWTVSVHNFFSLNEEFQSLKPGIYWLMTIFSPNVHWWANQTRSWLLKTMTFRTVWIHQLIGQRLSLPSYDTHPTWLSLTNKLKFDDELDQINQIVVHLWGSNYVRYKMWGEITYPLPIFNGTTVDVCNRITYFIPNFIRRVITCPCLELIHVSKRFTCNQEVPNFSYVLCQLFAVMFREILSIFWIVLFIKT